MSNRRKRTGLDVPAVATATRAFVCGDLTGRSSDWIFMRLTREIGAGLAFETVAAGTVVRVRCLSSHTGDGTLAVSPVGQERWIYVTLSEVEPYRHALEAVISRNLALIEQRSRLTQGKLREAVERRLRRCQKAAGWQMSIVPYAGGAQ